jgi:hypothetical protein
LSNGVTNAFSHIFFIFKLLFRVHVKLGLQCIRRFDIPESLFMNSRIRSLAG